MRSFYKMTDSFSNILKEICQMDGESLWEDITGNDDNPFVRKERSYSWLQWDGKTQEPVLCGADFYTDRTDILPVSCLIIAKSRRPRKARRGRFPDDPH